jgi:hypothetical protein
VNATFVTMISAGLLALFLDIEVSHCLRGAT